MKDAESGRAAEMGNLEKLARNRKYEELEAEWKQLPELFQK